MLKISTPSKIAGKLPCSYGQEPGKTCPGQTAYCRGECGNKPCYVERSRKQYKDTRNMLASNAARLAGLQASEAVAELSALVETASSRQRKAGHQPLFRIHWSGDFATTDQIHIWTEVCSKFPEVSFGAYTRSFAFAGQVWPEAVAALGKLAALDNVSLFASADLENLSIAKNIGFRLAYSFWKTTDEVPENTFPCPATSGKIDHNAACLKCRFCYRKGTKNVLFYEH